MWPRQQRNALRHGAIRPVQECPLVPSAVVLSPSLILEDNLMSLTLQDERSSSAMQPAPAAHATSAGCSSVPPTRDHLTYSAITTCQSCPARYAFRYVLGLPEETVSASLVFGGAIHESLEHHLRQLSLGRPRPDLGSLLDVYEAAWDMSKCSSPRTKATPRCIGKRNECWWRSKAALCLGQPELSSAWKPNSGAKSPPAPQTCSGEWTCSSTTALR